MTNLRGEQMSKLGIPIIDADIHCLEPSDLWLSYIDKRFIHDAPRPQHQPGVPGRLQVLDRPIPARVDHPARREDYEVREQKALKRFKELDRIDVPDDGASPDSMVGAMTLEGIDIGIVYRTDAAHAIAHDDMSPHLANAICQAFNNWLEAYCQTHPSRLRPTAQLPLHNVELAILEAKRAVNDLGAVALVLPSNPVKGRPLYDPSYYSLWATIQDLNVPVAFHGIQLAYQEHLGSRYIENFALLHAAAHPVELMLSLGSMLLGGVFERFPHLTAVFLEGQCGWLPFWLDCLDDRWNKFGNENRFPLRHTPSHYFRQHCYVSADPDERLLPNVISMLGDDNIVFSTDWPHHDSLYPKAVSRFFDLPGLTDINRRKILWENARKLYNV